MAKQDYSAAERERASEQVDAAMMLRPESKMIGAMTVIAIDLQCELNRAVDLVRKAHKRLAHTGDCLKLLPTEEWTKERGNRYLDCECYVKEFGDFLSHYPEGELR